MTVENDLTVDQVVTFSGFASPFSMSENPVNVPALGTATVDWIFTPVSIAEFEFNVTCTGSAFGTDSLYLYGEGSLPQAALIEDEFSFGTVSVNTESTVFIPVVNTGIGTLFVSEVVSENEELYLDGGLSISQGDTVMVPLKFFPELNGSYEMSGELITNDPFDPNLEFSCTAEVISSISGSLCGNLSIANSPYSLSGDVTVPASCSLTIEPGVVLALNGHTLHALGELNCAGSAAQRVTIENGQINFSESSLSAQYTDISNDVSLNIVNRQTIYENDFENGSQPFRCYTNWSSGYQTDGNWDWGCDNFSNTQNESWCSNGVRALQFTSVRYSGWLELDEPIQIEAEGLYQWSFNYKNLTQDRGRILQAQYQIDGGNWIDFYSSFRDSYCVDTERFSPFSDFINISEGSSVNIRISHNGTGYYNSNSCNDHITSFIDDLRFEKVEVTPIEIVLFGNQETLGGSSTLMSDGCEIVGPSYSFGETGTAIRMQTGEGQQVAFWHSRPISVHSNKLYLKFQEKISIADANCWYKLEYRISQGPWVLLSDRRNENCNSSVATHGWEERNYIIEHLEFGEQVEFRIEIEAYDIGNPAYRDFTLFFDDFIVIEDFAQPIAVKGDNALSFELNESTISGDVLLVGDGYSIEMINSELDGLFVEGSNANLEGDSCALRSIDIPYENSNVYLSYSEISNPTGTGMYLGSSASLSLYSSSISNCGGTGVATSSNSDISLNYSFISSNGGDGIEQGFGSQIDLENTLVAYNQGFGVLTAGTASLDYSVFRANGNEGLRTSEFSTIENSVFWFNGGVPQLSTDNVFAISYSNIQGINSLLTSPSFAWGDGCIGTDPVFADSLSHLDPFSPCVDGGKPWEHDAHIPYGLGSSRADMGLYGGPQNAFWGGQAPPDGSVIITDVFDIPDDQGGELGIQFSASPFDFGGLGFNVTHYSVWRDLAVDSDSLIDVANGNWEQIGTVPAQGFNQYGYTAETLVNSNPGNPACMTNFIVLAHTTDNNIYWVSDVAGACAIDNLAPSDPDINGFILDENPEEVAVQIHWAAPEEADYAYTEITSDAGFEAQLNNDTLVIDESVVYGEVYTYTVTHFDINGNASNPASLAIEASAGADLIPLVPGWNLVSSDRMPAPAALQTIVASLQPGNLDYVTSFNAGVQFYDPDGLSFLNTLESWTGGYGYWVKVAEADTLELTGSPVPADYLPALNAGWNLVGYPNAAAVSPAIFFEDFIAQGTLEYVTGFNQGSSFYDPDGLPFLNTLNGMYNGLGYWVKVTEAYDPNGMVLAEEEPLAALSGASTAQPNPNFMLVNGTSDLTEAAGDYVKVLAAGRLVGRLPILQGGYLMTTALFGDDPATLAIEGIEPGMSLEFQFRGNIADQTIEYAGDMELRQLALTFGASATAVDVFPNPFTESLQIAVELPHEGRIECQLIDATGRVVAERAAEMHAAGAVSLNWDVPGLTHGMYTCQMVLDGKVWSTVPLVRVE